MRDAVELLNQGIPAAVIITPDFRSLAENQALSLGRPDLPILQIPGSLASLRRDEVPAAVERAAVALRQQFLDLWG